MLDHIHIENFRLFKNLDIPKVGQVNLITGKNNSGKTTLLEALRLWANRKWRYEFENTLLNVLKDRGDWNDGPQAAFESLFFNRDPSFPIAINDSFEIIYNPDTLFFHFKNGLLGDPIDFKEPDKTIFDKSFYVPAGFDLLNVHLWEKAAFKERQIVDVLRIIEPSIRDIRVDPFRDSAKVLLENSNTPRPLKNFGEGMNRLLTVALGLVSAENDMLLIDEIDLGLHHSVQHLLWEIVFQKAKDLNVQVFATTHSSDCVEAFSHVANKPEYAGMGNYIRLQRKKDGDIVAVDYEMEELESAMDLNLETR